MNLNSLLSVSATLPDGSGYINLYKVAVVVILVLAWGLASQWVDRDTDVVKTQREPWNLIVVSGAFVGFFALFLPPWHGIWFLAGIAFWLALAGGALAYYVAHRNSRVVPAARVLTIAHFRRLMSGNAEGRRPKDAKGLRIRLENHKGKFVERPSDPAELQDYEATQDFLYDILSRRASELDMRASGTEGYRADLQIDGVGTKLADDIPAEQGERIIRFIKRIAGLNVEEIRRPQRGKIHLALLSESKEPGYSDVITSGSTAGERLRIRLHAGAELRRLAEIGLASQRLEVLKEILGKPTGLLIVSATKGHGVSTTQYAILRSHDAYMHNIHTLERRSTIELDNITQQVYEGANTDVNYARVLQTVLRREPDIVLVADCEDRETVQVAARAAADDRKIYLGMQAKDTFDALAQYLKYVENNQVASSALLGVTNQRLVRKLCTECREAYRPDSATLAKLNLPADKIECFYRPPSEPKFDRKGKPILCPACQGTGYNGRLGVFEVLAIDDTIRNLIVQGAPIKSIKSHSRKKRMYYLQEEGLLKVIDGTTSMNEVLRVLRNNDKRG